MVIPKEILTDFKEIHEKAFKLVNEESKNDPITNPYRSHYAARELLLEMKENLKNTVKSESDKTNNENEYIYKVIIAFVCRDLGKIYAFTEEISASEKQFRECLELVTEYRMEPEAILPYVDALNELGIIYANLEDHKKSLDLLIKAEEAFNEFKIKGLNALSLTDIFGTRDEVEEGKGCAELENLYTLCTFYLAQVYEHLNELEKSAKYCHRTLRRQMDLKSYEPIDFALNAATLSQYYIGQNMFKVARHLLSAATLVMAEHEATMVKPDMSEPQRADVIETFKHRHADLARCWAKYGIALLLASKERLFNDDEKKIAADAQRLNINPESYRFPEMKLTTYEDRITADYCLTFDDAKPVYHFVISWLDEAKDYYKPETEATEYAKIIKDYAELYQYIAFFEEDPLNQSKMHKRRAKYYEDLLELLNPTFYMSICRDCWYGAGLAQCVILDIKIDMVKDKNSPSPQDIQKINQICHKAISHFLSYINSYMEKDGITLKSDMIVEEQTAVLHAYFNVGRLYYKIIKPADHAQQLEYLENSLKYYKLFIDECDVRKEAAESLQEEVGVCKEMIKLLALIIDKKRVKRAN